MNPPYKNQLRLLYQQSNPSGVGKLKGLQAKPSYGSWQCFAERVNNSEYYHGELLDWAAKELKKTETQQT